MVGAGDLHRVARLLDREREQAQLGVAPAVIGDVGDEQHPAPVLHAVLADAHPAAVGDAEGILVAALHPHGEALVDEVLAHVRVIDRAPRDPLAHPVLEALAERQALASAAVIISGYRLLKKAIRSCRSKTTSPSGKASAAASSQSSAVRRCRSASPATRVTRQARRPVTTRIAAKGRIAAGVPSRAKLQTAPAAATAPTALAARQIVSFNRAALVSGIAPPAPRRVPAARGLRHLRTPVHAGQGPHLPADPYGADVSAGCQGAGDLFQL